MRQNRINGKRRQVAALQRASLLSRQGASIRWRLRHAIPHVPGNIGDDFFQNGLIDF